MEIYPALVVCKERRNRIMTISLIDQMECQGCHKLFDELNTRHLCRTCTENTLVSMHCQEPDCNHSWKHPGVSAWCPLCGSSRVTSDDETIDAWMWQREAKNNEVQFIGMQKGLHGALPFPVFQDLKTGSFSLMAGESVADALARKRWEFQKKGD